MRIGIDARFFGALGKGLGRYTQKLIEHLEKIDHENQYFIFLVRENFEEYQPRNKNFQKVLADFRWYTLAEQFKFPGLLKKYRLDLVHFPHFNVPLLYRRPFVITIHDLILLNFPTLRGTTRSAFGYGFKFLAYRLVIWSAIRRAQKVIAVSNFTRDDIRKNYSIVPEKIAVTYEAADHFLGSNLSLTGEELKVKYGIISPYLLYVGNAYPHKNLERLVLAFVEIKKAYPKLSLVLVGKEDYFYQRIKRLVFDQKIPAVIFSGFIPDEHLQAVYENSEAYVFPSLYEGFGLPPLEAMVREVPVVAADRPCLREILGDSAEYFDPEDESDMARKIIAVLANEEIKAQLKNKGRARVKEFSWDKMATATLKIYQSELKAEK